MFCVTLCHMLNAVCVFNYSPPSPPVVIELTLLSPQIKRTACSCSKRVDKRVFDNATPGVPALGGTARRLNQALAPMHASLGCVPAPCAADPVRVLNVVASNLAKDAIMQ